LHDCVIRLYRIIRLRGNSTERKTNDKNAPENRRRYFHQFNSFGNFCKSTKIINENRPVKKQNTTMIDEKIGLRWKSPDMRWEIEIVIYSKLNNVSSG